MNPTLGKDIAKKIGGTGPRKNPRQKPIWGRPMSKKKLSDFSAAPHALGYLYQCRYALLLMLDRGRNDLDCQLSIEKFDDVAFEKSGSPTELIQLKHHLKASGNLTDSSPDLWKTLNVWCAGIDSGEIIPEKTMLFIITTEICPSDGIVAHLGPASLGGRDPDTALKLLEEAAPKTTSKKCEPGVQAFLNLAQSQRERLVKAIHVLTGSLQAPDLRQKIEEVLHYCTSSSFLSSFVDRVEGWWFSQVILRLSGRELSSIKHVSVELQMDDLRSQFQRDSLPIDYLDALPDPNYLQDAQQRLFVQQLQMIRIANPLITRAIRDFYRAYLQRARWLGEGFLQAGEWDKYELSIKDEWELALELLKQQHNLDLLDESACSFVGQTLYSQLMALPNPPKIRDRCNEPYVLRGALHELADRVQIGWHPNFLAKLQNIVGTR